MVPTAVAEVAAVAVAEVAVVVVVEALTMPNNLNNQGVQNTQTCPQAISSGAGCITNGAKEVTSVQRRQHALGKTSQHLVLQNHEGQTSPAK